MSRPGRDRWSEEPKLSGWFVAWFVFCALVGLGFMGVVVWAIIEVVGRVTR